MASNETKEFGEKAIPLDEGSFYTDEAKANAAFRWLRQDAPLWWFAPRSFWVVSRRDDVQSMSRRPELWSSEGGITMPQGAGPDRRRAEENPPLSIIQMDPPQHNQHRALINRAFTPKRVKDLEARMREIAIDSIEDAEPGTTIDFVEKIAVPLPMRVIAEMLGVPDDDLDSFRRWSDAVIVQAGADSDWEEGQQAVGEVFAYFATMLEKRRAEPGNDLITALLTAEVDGRALNEGEILIFCMTLLVAGNETTRNLISQGTRLLLEHPEQLARMRSGEVALADAIEELLRLTHPIRYFFRRSRERVEMHGKTIEPGDAVMMLYAAANRDETVWGDTADQLDITRPVEPNVSLGFGQHFCMGASLARLEARVLFEELLQRRPRWELNGEIQFVGSSFVNGIDHMPVVLGA